MQSFSDKESWSKCPTGIDISLNNAWEHSRVLLSAEYDASAG